MENIESIDRAENVRHGNNEVEKSIHAKLSVILSETTCVLRNAVKESDWRRFCAVAQFKLPADSVSLMQHREGLHHTAHRRACSPEKGNLRLLTLSLQWI